MGEFGKRGIAQLIDLAAVSGVATLLEWALRALWAIATDTLSLDGIWVETGSPEAQILMNGFCFFAVSIPYCIWGWTRWGTTFGKRGLGLEVVDAHTGKLISNRQAWIRYSAYVFSGLMLGLGWLAALFHPQGFAWHDQISNTRCRSRRDGSFSTEV